MDALTEHEKKLHGWLRVVSERDPRAKPYFQILDLSFNELAALRKMKDDMEADLAGDDDDDFDDSATG